LAVCLAGLEFVHQAASGLHASALRPLRAAAPADAEAIVGTPLGDFHLLRELGRGGMGVVYEAEQLSLGRRVALKVLPFAAALDAKQLQRFKNEAQAAAHLHHTNIVPIFGVGCERGVHYYAMQFIEGQTLAEVIRDLRQNVECRMTNDERMTNDQFPSMKEPVPGADAQTHIRHSTLDLLSSLGIRHSSFYRTVAQLGVQAAEALEHAHQLGIIHRDIKPANLLVDGGGRLWITDFGLAYCQSQPGLTMTGDVLGTLRYMSPEQALAKRVAVDARTDIYSLGVTLYELLTLEPAYNGRDREELLRQIAFEEPRLPSRLNKAVPVELETIVLKAMAKNPEERYSSAQELADELRRFLEDKPIRAKRPTLRQRTVKWARRHKTVVRAALVVLVLAVLGLAVGSGLIWQANQELRQNLYYQRIALAEREWSANNLGRMQQLLEECPADLRRWEWHYLKRLQYKNLPPLRHDSGLLCLAFSPDSQCLASGSRDGVIHLWDAHTGQRLRIFRVRAGEPMVRRVAFSPDGQRLAAAYTDSRIRIWDVQGDKEPLDWEAHRSTVLCVVFSPDGKLLASSRSSSGWEEEPAGGEAKVWDAATGEEILTFRGQPQGVVSLAFSPDGRRLASGGEEKTVKLWDVTTGQEMWTSPAHTAPVLTVAFSPDGRSVASAGADLSELSHGEVKIWDAQTGEPRRTLRGHIGYIHSIAFSPDGRRLAAAGLDRTVKLWNVATGRETLTLRGHQLVIRAVAFSPDGRQLASASLDRTVRIWDATPLEEKPGDEPLTLHVHPAGGVLDVAFHPDNQRLATVADDVKLWDRHTGKKLFCLADSEGCWCIAFSPDGQLLAGGKKGEVKVWEIRTGQILHSLSGFRNVTSRMAFSPDSRHLVSAHFDRTVRVWDMATGHREDRIPAAHAEAILGLALSPDGKSVVTTSVDETVKVWDAATGRPIGTLEPPHAGPCWCVAFRSDGELLASGSGDGTIKLWDTQSWKQQGDDLRDPSEGMKSLAFSPDGRLLAWGSMDATVRVWHALTKEIQTLRSHTSRVRSVAFSPDGEWIASASLDGTVKIWKAPPLPE
jgi:WD40 repeat protein/serine/threonine protein kinase